MQESDTLALLASWRAGERASRDLLFERLYPELRQVAAAILRRERNVSLSARDLIHEAILRLIAIDRIDWAGRAHFMALASIMVRRALIAHVRAKNRLKRRHEIVTLAGDGSDVPDLDVEAVHDALERLATIDPVRADIVEMRFFGGMEIAEVTAVLGLSESTVKRKWSAARLWLAEALRDQAA